MNINQINYPYDIFPNSNNYQTFPQMPMNNLNSVFIPSNMTMDNRPKDPNSVLQNGDAYLQPHPFKQISSNDFNSFLAANFDSSDLQNVKQHIISLPIIKDMKNSIGPLSYLAQLTEVSYGFDPNLKHKMLSQYEKLYSTIYKWRKVKADGNCFYRAVIFSFLENAILSANVQLFQNIIYDIKICFDDPKIHKYSYVNSTMQIKLPLVLKIMVLIYVALKKNQINQAYEIYNKAINNCDHFDFGLILYFRFILYKYIKANETKFYKQDFGVKIGNLLPSQYETENGQFLFEEFYDKYLLKMNQDTEKIVVYITPFVLCTKVDVVIFNCEYENNHNEFDFPRNGSPESDFTILLICNKEHYEQGYCKNYYSRNKEILAAYKAEVYRNIILVEIDNEKDEMNDIDLFHFKDNHGPLNGQSIINPLNPLQQNNGNLMVMNGANNLMRQGNVNYQLNQNQLATNQMIPLVKCPKCNCNVKELTKAFGICSSCFNKELSIQISNTYMKCLNSFKSFFKTNKNSSEYIKMFGTMFNNSKIVICTKETLIEPTIQSHNQNAINKIYLNYFLTKIKASKCLNCFQDINDNSKISLPCLCVMCSGKCLNEYYTNANKIEYRRQKDFCCHCGAIYEPYQLIALCLLLFQYKMIQTKDDILMLHKNQLKGKCSKCQSSIPNIQDKVVINCSNVRNELINLLGITTFNHSLCKKCYNSQLKSYFCSFCRCEHAILKQMSTNSDEGFI